MVARAAVRAAVARAAVRAAVARAAVRAAGRAAANNDFDSLAWATLESQAIFFSSVPFLPCLFTTPIQYKKAEILGDEKRGAIYIFVGHILGDFGTLRFW